MRSDHVLAALHWLPVRFRRFYCLFIFKALNGQTPAFICDQPKTLIADLFDQKMFFCIILCMYNFLDS